MSSANPFSAPLEALQLKIYVQNSPAVERALSAFCGVFAVALALAITSLVLRWRRGCFWTYRTQTTEFGRMIAPNPMVCFLLWSVVFLGLLQGNIYYVRAASEVGSDLSNSMVWRCIVWAPLLIGGINLSWATTIAPLQSRQVSEPAPSFDLARHPHAVSTVFIVFHILSIATLLWLSLMANSKFNSLFAANKALERALEAGLAAVQRGDLMQIGQVQASLATLIQTSRQKRTELLLWWRGVWIAYAALDAVLLIIFLLATIAHHRSLQRSINNLNEGHASKLGASGMGFSRQMKALIWGYRTLVFTTAAVFSIAIAYFGLSIFLAAKISEIADGTQLTEVAILLSYYIFAIFGTVSNLVTLLHSLLFHSGSAASSPPTTMGELPKPHLDIKPTEPAQATISRIVSSGSSRYSITFEMVSHQGLVEGSQEDVAIQDRR